MRQGRRRGRSRYRTKGHSETGQVCRSNTREVSQIGKVDVSVNMDVESHPVGFTTPQKTEVQSSKCYFFLATSKFARYFPLKFKIQCKIVFRIRDKQ